MANPQTIGNKIAPPRFLAFLGAMIASFPIAVGFFHRWALGAMAAFDIAAILFLGLCLSLLKTTECAVIRKHAASNDANREVLLGVTGVVSDQVQLVGQATADAQCAERLADVEERELRDLGAKMWHDHSDPNQPSVREGAECDPARVDVTLEGVPLRRDGVLAVPVRVPGGRAPVPAPLFEFGPTLLVDEVNTLGTVDLGDPRQLYPR